MIQKLAVPFILMLVACAPINRMRTPSYASEWQVVLHRASLAADSGSYANAERILTVYTTKYPGTREAHETLFWHAMFKLDPGNTGGSIPEGLTTLDKYLSDTATIVHRSEAKILKRLAMTAQVLQAKAITPAVRDTTILKATSEAEIASLRAELAKTTAELERIKKRLANPNK